MREYRLDGREMTTRGAAHAALKRTLLLPDYYGRNLDALHDCLTDIGEPTHITLAHAQALTDALGSYGGLMIRVLTDAALLNPYLEVSIDYDIKAPDEGL